MRFDKYNDLWTKTTLNTVVERITRRNTNNESNLPLTISAQYGLINQNEFFNKQIASRDLTNYILLNRGEFAYNKSYSSDYPWGAVKRLDKYDKGVLSSLYMCFAPKSNVDSDFLVHHFETPKWYNEISNIAGEGARNHGLLNMAVSDYFNTRHSFPSIQEQHKISQFLNLINKRIDTQSKIIEKYESLISTIRTNIFSSFQGKWTKLCDLVENKSLQLNRGNIIPKHAKDDVYKYPVYSSSVQKDGLMGYSDYYMFDKELITWSIDGGGDMFFREKHKFCVTNVCGILQLDTNKFSYRFVAEALKYQHSKMTFDYQTKAHPSVIEKLYALPDIELNEQNKYSKLFEVLYSKLGNERKYLAIIKEQKKYLLSNMFI